MSLSGDYAIEVAEAEANPHWTITLYEDRVSCRCNTGERHTEFCPKPHFLMQGMTVAFALANVSFEVRDERWR